MSIIKKDPAAETVGVAPKAAWPTVALIGLGVVLCVLDKTGVVDIDDTLWLALLGGGVGVGGISAAAPAALQRVKEPARTPSVQSSPTRRRTDRQR